MPLPGIKARHPPFSRRQENPGLSTAPCDEPPDDEEPQNNPNNSDYHGNFRVKAGNQGVHLISVIRLFHN
jgi:hypothetical protein